MKILIMTDVEGCAGVLDFKNWTARSSPYYEKAKRLLPDDGYRNASMEEYRKAKLSAKHQSPVTARKLIKAAAREAIDRLAFTSINHHPSSIIELLNQPLKLQ